jgi:hypothetical protein
MSDKVFTVSSTNETLLYIKDASGNYHTFTKEEASCFSWKIENTFRGDRIKICLNDRVVITDPYDSRNQLQFDAQKIRDFIPEYQNDWRSGKDEKIQDINLKEIKQCKDFRLVNPTIPVTGDCLLTEPWTLARVKIDVNTLRSVLIPSSNPDGTLIVFARMGEFTINAFIAHEHIKTTAVRIDNTSRIYKYVFDPEDPCRKTDVTIICPT